MSPGGVRSCQPGGRLPAATCRHPALLSGRLTLESLRSPTNRPRALVVFFLVTFAVTWAFWIPAAMSQRGLITLPIPLAAAGLAGAWTPSLAGLVMTAAGSGRAGVKRLLDRLTIWRVGIGWYLFALLWPPILSLIVTGVSMLFGRPAPDFANPPVTSVYPAPREAFAAGFLPLLPVVFTTQLFGSSLGEELGWRGYALPRLQAGRSAFLVSLLLGLLWGVWHLPRFWVPGAPLPAAGFAWFVAGIALATVLYTWLYNNTGGSLLLVILLHTSQAVTDLFLARVRNPQLLALVTALLVVAVVLRSGAARLTRGPLPDAAGPEPAGGAPA